MSTATEPHMIALEKANRIRLARASLKREITALPWRLSLNAAARVLMDPPPEAQTMPVSELLMAVHRVGRRQMRRLLLPHMISEQRRLADLTERQRQVLSGALLAQGERRADR